MKNDFSDNIGWGRVGMPTVPREKEVKSVRRQRYWSWLGLALLCLLVVVAGLNFRHHAVPDHRPAVITDTMILVRGIPVHLVFASTRGYFILGWKADSSYQVMIKSTE